MKAKPRTEKQRRRQSACPDSITVLFVQRSSTEGQVPRPSRRSSLLSENQTRSRSGSRGGIGHFLSGRQCERAQLIVADACRPVIGNEIRRCRIVQKAH